jgi:hypothetical protein
LDKFTFYFDKANSLWIDVYLYDVHPNTFASWKAGRWAYWEAESFCRSGLFGSLHFIRDRLRVDTISHELDHVRQEWLWGNRGAWTGRNEESTIEIKDRLFWRFLRALSKVEPKAKVWMKTLSQI